MNIIPLGLLADTSAGILATTAGVNSVLLNKPTSSLLMYSFAIVISTSVILLIVSTKKPVLPWFLVKLGPINNGSPPPSKKYNWSSLLLNQKSPAANPIGCVD